MVERSPLVFVDGGLSQLPPGDSIVITSDGSVSTVSGVQGGGVLGDTPTTLSLKIKAEASGLYVSSSGLGVDGAAQVSAETALASGNAALVLAETAVSSGIAATALATTALASGNAALTEAGSFTSGNVIAIEAASDVQVGNPVGFDDTGRIQVITSGSPTYGSRTNFVGIAQATATSGASVNVLVPKAIDYNQTSLSTGYFYYIDPTTSGFTSASGQPAAWSGLYTWEPVGKAVSSSGLLLIRTL